MRPTAHHRCRHELGAANLHIWRWCYHVIRGMLLARVFGSMVGLIFPGLGAANAGAFMPVGWEAMVYVKKRKKATVYKARPIMPRAGETGDAGGAAGGKARSTDKKHKPTRVARIFYSTHPPKLPGQNSRERFFRRRFEIFLEGSNRFKKRSWLNRGQLATRQAGRLQHPQFYVQRSSGFCWIPLYCSGF
jgi:hypothetical protein